MRLNNKTLRSSLQKSLNTGLSLLVLLINLFISQAQISRTIAIPDSLKGKEYQLSGCYYAPDSGMLVLATKQSNERSAFLKNRFRHQPAITAEDNWRCKSIQGKIRKNSKVLSIAVVTDHKIDRLNLDYVELKFLEKGHWQRVALANNDFELPMEAGMVQAWEVSQGYSVRTDTSMAFSGRQSLFFEKEDLLRYGDFDAHGQRISINNIEVYYEVYGQGEPLLLLHGNNQSIAAFNHQIDWFRKHFKVIAVDSRGQGHSTMDGQRISNTLMAKDMALLLDSLHLDSVHVVGWSDGGNTGLIMAMNYPSKVKTLTTMGANIYIKRGVIDQKFLRNYRWEVRLLSMMSLVNPKKWKNTLRIGKMPLKYPDIQPEDLASIHCPVLVMAADNDLIARDHTQLIADHIKDSRLTILQHTSHFAPSETPDLFNREVLNFLSQEAQHSPNN